MTSFKNALCSGSRFNFHPGHVSNNAFVTAPNATLASAIIVVAASAITRIVVVVFVVARRRRRRGGDDVVVVY
jgi:hypothetical protein